ncbi:MAG: FCD domain-containing protein [Gemmataceae bacterium]
MRAASIFFVSAFSRLYRLIRASRSANRCFRSRNPDRLADGYEEHCRIAEAVLVGDAELAACFIQEHLDRGKSLLLSPRQA